MAYFQRLCQSRVSVIRFWFYAIDLFFGLTFFWKPLKRQNDLCPKQLSGFFPYMPWENRKSGHASDQSSSCWFPVTYLAYLDLSSHDSYLTYILAIPQNYEIVFCGLMTVDWFIRITKKAQALKPAEVEVDEGRGLVGAIFKPANQSTNLSNLPICGSKSMVGFYIVPPCEADCLVVVEAVDEDKNNIQHLAVTWRNAVTNTLKQQEKPAETLQSGD